MNKLTEQDIISIKYYWDETRNLERWTGWEDVLPLLCQEYPEVVKAWEDYKIAKLILTRIIKSLEFEEEGK